jgi:hypothetical protein
MAYEKLKQLMDDYESRQFAKLAGTKRHYCPDWDYMAIDEHCSEIDGCTCSFPPESVTS